MPHRLNAIATGLVLLLVIACNVLSSNALAQTAPETPSEPATLRIATKQAPPFAMKSDGGDWSGIAIELMQEVARNLGKTVNWVEMKTTAELLDAQTRQQADAAIAAITVTGEREKTVDFSHGYYDSGLAIAIRRDGGASFWAGLIALGSPAFLGTVAMLALLLLVTGAVVWFIERRQNPEQFDQHPIRGIGSGFWWAAVTMTTVGYGDKAPVTPLGRFIAVIWMFAALILTAVFTAQLTSALTINRLSGPVTGLNDLYRNRVGIVRDTASKEYFSHRAISTIGFDSVSEGLDALEQGVIDAFVHDEPILQYDIQRRQEGRIELLPETFDAQVYAIALPSGSDLRETLNRELLTVLASPRWTGIKTKYLGQRAEN